jgi:glycosyltransferase involved in cell wall biosynthesis
MDGEPLVSVVMTAYNESDYIREGIESIQNQTIRNWELIVVDDGSVDETRSIASSISELDSRICLIESEHVGRAGALNIGLQNTQAPFVAILDADDKARVHRLERQIQHLRNHPEIGIVGGGCRFTDWDNNEQWTWIPPKSPAEVRRYALLGMPLPHTSILFRRELLDCVGGYRDRNYKDYDFLIRVLEHTKGTNMQEVLVDVTVHEESVMGTLRAMEGLKSTIRSRFQALRTLSSPHLMPFHLLLTIGGISYKAFRLFIKDKKI